MAWTLKGHITENWSCNMFCPCWFGVQEYMIMDEGWCDTSVTWEIEEGQSDGVDLSGRIVTFLADFPGPTLFDGNGTARLYLDDGASDDQARELEAIFQGKKSGSFEIVGGLISTWLATRRRRSASRGTVTSSLSISAVPARSRRRRCGMTKETASR